MTTRSTSFFRETSENRPKDCPGSQPRAVPRPSQAAARQLDHCYAFSPIGGDVTSRDGSVTESVNRDAGHISWDSKPKTAAVGVFRFRVHLGAGMVTRACSFRVDGALTVCADRPMFRPSEHLRGLIRVGSHRPARRRTPKEKNAREQRAPGSRGGLRRRTRRVALPRYASSRKVRVRRFG
jgi:hypothetical protein